MAKKQTNSSFRWLAYIGVLPIAVFLVYYVVHLLVSFNYDVTKEHYLWLMTNALGEKGVEECSSLYYLDDIRLRYDSNKPKGTRAELEYWMLSNKYNSLNRVYDRIYLTPKNAAVFFKPGSTLAKYTTLNVNIVGVLSNANVMIHSVPKQPFYTVGVDAVFKSKNTPAFDPMAMSKAYTELVISYLADEICKKT